MGGIRKKNEVNEESQRMGKEDDGETKQKKTQQNFGEIMYK